MHWFALGWNRFQHADVRLSSVHDNPVGGLFIGLAGVYATEFFASMSPDQSRAAVLGKRALGTFRIGTGLWLMYFTFAAAFNFILNYNLPL